ncbi:unnamed protein product [Symbiodinium natans]|uniref:Uncharacterized protein n=1 Tax=Symbiodinium natans TaxID=878477 RepID=A0A812I029_9DINO|nr:unnamed protein product [Symbiodinium natans]
MRRAQLAGLWLLVVRAWARSNCSPDDGECELPDTTGFVQVTHKTKAKAKDDAESPHPDFGPNVIVLEPGEASTQVEERLQSFYEQWISWDEDAQFGDHRTAILLKPGEHQVDINLWYYVGVYGLGKSPLDVVARHGPRGEGLRVEQQPASYPGGPLLPNTNTFWRTIENVHVAQDKLDFFVSQAAPLRSVRVDGNVHLSGGGTDWTSGGALMNSDIIGEPVTGTQQQWYTRGTTMRPYDHPAGQGSYACVGCIDRDSGLPFYNSFNFDEHRADQTFHKGLTYAAAPEVFAEKPYIFFDEGTYKLRIPEVLNNHAGPDWQTGSTVEFDQVFLTKEGTTAAEINAAIAAGMHIVITPAVYYLEEPIVIDHPNTVILGLGFATLIPQKLPVFVGRGVIEVGNVDGVRLAGVFVQAGPQDSSDFSKAVGALVRWGKPENPYAGKKSNPGFIYDFIARVGGPDHQPVGVANMLEINNGWVVGDNLWLWKADHCVSNSGALCKPQRYVNHCLVVNAENVHMYGLMAEHANEDVCVWNGEYGKTIFYQSEFKYTLGEASKPGTWQDVPHAVSYRVNAINHEAAAFGIYAVVLAEDVDDEETPMANVQMQGGFSAISVRDVSTYRYGFKDVSALNWNGNWPEQSRINCKAWVGSTRSCLDAGVGVPR